MMKSISLLRFCSTLGLFAIISLIKHGKCTGDIEYGLTQAENVGKGVCWIHKVKPPYPIDEERVSYPQCVFFMSFLESLRSFKNGLSDTWSKQQKPPSILEQEKTLGEYLEGTLTQKFSTVLPKYSSCHPYLKDIHKKPSKDFGKILHDAEGGDYPYRGFAHCLVAEVEKNLGNKAVDDLKSRFAKPKSFIEAIRDRENEHRAQHGSPPLQLDDELTKRAQKWADYLANVKCGGVPMRIEKPNDPDLTYKGVKTGENIEITNTFFVSDEVIGEVSANSWYEEIADYPWPAYTGKNAKAGKPTGSFTQTVWKATTHVGYAIARGSKCNLIAVVARYWPVGNTIVWGTTSDYAQNVLPRKQ